MRKAFLIILKVLAWTGLTFLWFVIEGVLFVSWFSIMAFSVGGWLPLIIVNALLVLAIICRKKIKMRLLKSVVCATITGIIITAITFVGITTYSNDFTPEKWKKYPMARFEMIDNLEEEHNLVGMTKAEISELLGEPNHISQRLYGYETYEYYYNYTYSIAKSRYLVNFSDNGTVHSVYNNFD